MDQIINHAVLSLDFWQDTVTYEGSTMPTGTIGCEVLNIPDSTIEKLDTPCNCLLYTSGRWCAVLWSAFAGIAAPSAFSQQLPVQCPAPVLSERFGRSQLPVAAVPVLP